MRRVLVLLVAGLLAGGCSATPAVTGSPSAPPPSTSTPSTPEPTTPAPATPTPASSPSVTPTSESPAPPETPTTEIEITLADGGVDPSGERVDIALGTTVRLVISSDRDDEIHVHGFDIETEVTAGKTATVEFVADQSGRFEVESHHPEKLILELLVR